jgi:hypothetical protein
MKQSTYNKVSGLVFAIVAVAHAVRALNNWNLTVNGMVLPVGISWVVVFLLVFLSYQALSAKK